MSATEYNDSRLGVAGTNGTNFARRFLVTSPTDANGASVEPAFDSELRQKAPLGSDFRGMPGAVCTDYAVVFKHDKTKWDVEALYGVPSILNPGSGGAWRVEMTGNLDVQFTDVIRLTEAERSGEKDPLAVGPFAYQPIVFGPQLPAEDFLWFTTTNSKGEEIELKVPKDPKKQRRVIVGMDYYPPASVVTCVRRFEDANALRSMKVMAAKGAVNDDDFNILGRGVFTKGQVILADHKIVEIVGSKQDQPLEHEITLAFAIRLDTWQHAVVHTYSDDNETGAAGSIVFWKDNNPNVGDKARPVEETFRRQFWFKYGGFLEGL